MTEPTAHPLKAHSMIRGVFYTCGCYLGSELATPLFAFCPTCYTHHAPIEKIITLEGKEIFPPKPGGSL